MGLQPEEFPVRQQRSIPQVGAPQADCSAPTATLRPVNSLGTPVTPKTFVSQPSARDSHTERAFSSRVQGAS
eukprot:454390-Pyramimonas_sp.AAC.1